MLDKISNRNLIVLLVLLAAAVALFYFVDSKKTNRTFPAGLVIIDSALVSEVLLYPKATGGAEVKLEKTGKNWRVFLPSGKTAEAPSDKIANMIMEAKSIKPLRLAATKRSQWNDFQTDSTGTRVIMKEGDKVSLDIVIGKFTFNQQMRSATSYVRLFNDSNVYAINGFLEFTFNQSHNNWRNNTILKTKSESVLQLNFNYPDSSFTVAKSNNVWKLDEQLLDSATVANYLNSIVFTNSDDFADDVDPKTFKIPTYRLRVETMDEGTITINAFIDSSITIINSSFNPNSYFDGSINQLAEKLFVGKNKFTTQ